jgi:Ribonuclease G/E
MHATENHSVTILAAWSPGEVRVAAVANGTLADYALWRPGSPDGVGDLHRARVTAVVPAMAGAFVTLTGGTGEGFLPDSEGARGLTEGTILMVRVTRAALGGKGPRVSARVEGNTEGPVGLLRRGTDPLRELAARYPDAAILVDDPALAAALRADLAGRVTWVPRAFDESIETAVEELGASEVTLPNGVRLSVHPTPALVAIDIDGGGALTDRAAAERTSVDSATRRHRALNAAVLPELARQIRLRDLSGAILVDLAGMKTKQRAALTPALTAALANDPLRPRFLGFTALGLAEIARPRVRAPLHEMLAGPLAAGLVALRTIAQATRAEPGKRLRLRAAPSVIAALQADPVALAELARVTGQALNSRSDPSLPGVSWRIEDSHG